MRFVWWFILSVLFTSLTLFLLDAEAGIVQFSLLFVIVSSTVYSALDLMRKDDKQYENE